MVHPLARVMQRPTYGVSRAVRARRITEPAAMSRPPARASSNSRPPDMPAPPALGSSSSGMGVGVDVAVGVGTGVRVGVIVGGGVGVGVLVSGMSYEPATGIDGVGGVVGVPVGSGVACGVGVWVGDAVACGVAVLVAPDAGGGDPEPGRGVGVLVATSTGGGDPEPGRGVGVLVAAGAGPGGGDTERGVGVLVAAVPGGGDTDPERGVAVLVAAGAGPGGDTEPGRGVRVGVAVGVAVAVGVGVGVAVGVAVVVGVGVAVGVAVVVGVGVTVAVAVGVGVNGTCATRSVADQVFPPVPPTVLETDLLVMPAAVRVEVRVKDVVPNPTVMVYGDSVGAPERTQISLSTGAVQTTAIGSGGTWCVSCIPPVVTVVCVEETVLQVNAVEAMVVDRVKSEADGAPVGLPVRLSKPAAAGAVFDPDRASVTVIVPPDAAVADNVRNRSLPAVVVAVTYSSGIV